MPHSIKQRLDAGEIVRVISMGSLPSPKIIEIAGLTGDYHGLWIDQEHSCVSHTQLETLLLACRASGLDAFARVAPTDYATLMRPMETGCSGVMIAQVRTVEQVREAVQWTTYPPAGIRGMFLGNAECKYGRVSPADQVEIARQHRWLAVQIETEEAVECVDEIAATDGVDMLFVGPGDLSCALGVPGQMLHERCVAALHAVSNACQKSGTPWGTLSRSADHALACRELGCQLFSIASDIDLINRGFQSTHDLFEELA